MPNPGIWSNKDYDAVVVGSGPNGLSAAIRLQQAGLSVLLIEGKETIGGGMRSAELTWPGFIHDICSAVHPLAVSSPFLSSLPLKEHGLRFIYPEIAAAHPLDNGEAAVLAESVEQTAALLGRDEKSYRKLMLPLLKAWPELLPDILGPLQIPHSPLATLRFGLSAFPSALRLAKRFETEKCRALWAGMAAHSMLPLSRLTTSAVGLVLLAAGHANGWPIAAGGSQTIAKAMAAYFESMGGVLQTGFHVKSLNELPLARAVLFDLSPKQLLKIAGHKFSDIYKWQLNRFRYGMGVFKIDWALSEPIPFSAPECRKAGTVHLGATIQEIAQSEYTCAHGQHPEKPFVLLSQPSLFDLNRAPRGKHTAWAYCHVPNGSAKDITTAIEKQVERFAPGFRDIILARSTMNAAEMEGYNPNYVGGDINGGLMDIRQLFTRPALRLSPYKTSAKGIYICSSSTPPGGGVHGMCGFHAAEKALEDMFPEHYGHQRSQQTH